MSLLKNYFTRAIFFIVGDAAAITIASLFSYLIISSTSDFSYPFPLLSVISIVSLSLIFLGVFKMYQVSWRFTSLRELLMIVNSLAVASLIYLGTLFIAGALTAFHVSFIALVFIQSILYVGAFRISKRMSKEVLKKPHLKKRAIIFGAGNAGDQIMRDITRHRHWNLNIIAVFDDSEKLHGLSMHGVPVKGDRRRMYQFLRYSDIDELIIAIPSLPKQELKTVIEKVKSITPNLKVKVLPSFHLLSDDPVGVKNIREISIDDILGREPARIDLESIRLSLYGKTVLITGAGGSIGREIVRQCASLDAKKIIALDIDETEVFYIQKEFQNSAKCIEPCVANILDEERINQLFETEKPEVIYHAAAYKHVPMMEVFPEEAVKVNVEGTRVLSSLACKHEVEKFVLISTDKAVNPTNVMGATKRIAEEICLSFNELCVTKFISVRFGNVLGSRGSVVPIFIDQIRNGGPITITHPEVKRYFMTIPESVLLVMQAGVMGSGGEVFVLDMGEPVKILDMAKQLIQLHGLEPEKDIDIKFVGLRPGEKMYEELLQAEEGVLNTSHKLIFKAICGKGLDNKELNQMLAELTAEIKNDNQHAIRKIIKKLVPTYTFNGELNNLNKESKKIKQLADQE
jgi:FlaA1/EpsC-like NDP-sugar epimerase